MAMSMRTLATLSPTRRGALAAHLRPTDDPVPASYWVAAGAGAFVVAACYATAWWVPSVVADFAQVGLGPYVLAVGGALVTLFGLVLGLVVAAAPFLALRWPTFAIAVALAPGAFCVLYGAPVPFGILAALGAVAVTAGWRRPAASVAAVVCALVVTWAWVASSQRMAAPLRNDVDLRFTDGAAVGGLYTAALLLVLAGALGLRVAARREIERRGLAARAGQVEEHAAVVTERARLARDLHDVVAHHVSLIAVRAETAPYTDTELSPGARQVLGEIASDARLALDELRGVLGILGRAGDDPGRSPQPSWADIPALVARAREAGDAVVLEGDPGTEVPPAVGYVAYRVVQESLTNARKHAGGHPVLVRLEATAALVVVRVVNAGVRSPSGVGGGHGLVGMRERVEAVGGRLVAGWTDGEFAVEATLPRTGPR
jgi:signal transduction histidine kinase